MPRRKAAELDLEDEVGEKYFARRSIKLFGKSYKPGDQIPHKVMDSLPRMESLLRCGLVSKG